MSKYSAFDFFKILIKRRFLLFLNVLISAVFSFILANIKFEQIAMANKKYSCLVSFVALKTGQGSPVGSLRYRLDSIFQKENASSRDDIFDYTIIEDGVTLVLRSDSLLKARRVFDIYTEYIQLEKDAMKRFLSINKNVSNEENYTFLANNIKKESDIICFSKKERGMFLYFSLNFVFIFILLSLISFSFFYKVER